MLDQHFNPALKDSNVHNFSSAGIPTLKAVGAQEVFQHFVMSCSGGIPTLHVGTDFRKSRYSNTSQEIFQHFVIVKSILIIRDIFAIMYVKVSLNSYNLKITI